MSGARVGQFSKNFGNWKLRGKGCESGLFAVGVVWADSWDCG